MLKYKIQDKLDSLSVKEYSHVIHKIMDEGEISESTFLRWRKIKIDDKADIPFSKLEIIAKSLNCSIEDLKNKKPKASKANKLIRSQKIKVR